MADAVTVSPTRRILRRAWAGTFGRLLNQYERCLNEELAGCQSLLDVGCGFNSPVAAVTPRPPRIIGVDAWQPAIDQSRAAGIHDEYVKADVLEIASLFGPKSMDCVLASDLIEHLEEEHGYELIRQMEAVASRKVLIYTPNGYLPQGEEYGNPFQRHRSGWSAGLMQSLGYRVIGIEGFKPLRGEMARIRWRPHRFWLAASLSSQLVTERLPGLAFRILCVKEFPQ